MLAQALNNPGQTKYPVTAMIVGVEAEQVNQNNKRYQRVQLNDGQMKRWVTIWLGQNPALVPDGAQHAFNLKGDVNEHGKTSLSGFISEQMPQQHSFHQPTESYHAPQMPPAPIEVTIPTNGTQDKISRGNACNVSSRLHSGQGLTPDFWISVEKVTVYINTGKIPTLNQSFEEKYEIENDEIPF